MHLPGHGAAFVPSRLPGGIGQVRSFNQSGAGWSWS